MERNRYLPTDVILATTRTAFEFTRCQIKDEKIPIPRTSLAITAAILTAFPDINPRNALKKIGEISPLMIALNERADIGISANLRMGRGNLNQSQLWGLILLEAQTQKELEQRKKEFLQKYPQEKNTIEAAIEDFTNLSRMRFDFIIEEWPKFLEIDSAIFVCIYIHMANPQILQEAGVNLLMPAKTKREIENKYKLFTTKNTNNLSSSQKRLKAIFAAEMLLKVNDDLNDQKGLGIDKFLDIPSFARLVEKKQDFDLRKIKKHYEEETKIIFPLPIQKLAEAACSITSIIKAQTSKNGLQPSDNPVNFGICFKREPQNMITTLRHQLEAMTTISNLFSVTNLRTHISQIE